MDEFTEIESNVLVNGNDICDSRDRQAIVCSCKPLSSSSSSLLSSSSLSSSNSSLNSSSLFCCLTSRCPNYLKQIECVHCCGNCGNSRFRSRAYANIQVLDTPNKGKGLFARETLPPETFIREYVGEIISEYEFQRRRASMMANKHLFVAYLKKGSYIDSTNKASISRYINHSCSPNCRFETWSVAGRVAIGIFTTQTVPAGAELTFDYQWDYSPDRLPTVCCCGSSNCRGYLEVLTKEERRLVEAAAAAKERRNSKGERYVLLDPASTLRSGVWVSRADVPLEGRYTTITNGIQASSPSIEKHISGDRDISPNDVIKEEEQVTSSSIEESPSASSATSVAGISGGMDINPNWLVNKRIKVWWPGNLSYFDCDVTGYDVSSRMHTLVYINDGQVTEEYLLLKTNIPSLCGQNRQNITRNGQEISDWMWLDESRQEESITRKSNSGVAEEVVIVTSIESPQESIVRASSNPSPVTGSFQSIKMTRTDVEVTSAAARMLASKFLHSRHGVIDSLEKRATRDLADVMKLTCEYLFVEFEVVASSPNGSWASPSTSNVSNVLILAGDEAKLKAAINSIERFEDEIRAEQRQNQRRKEEEFQSMQGMVCVYDWRVLLPPIFRYAEECVAAQMRQTGLISSPPTSIVRRQRDTILYNISLSLASRPHMIGFELIPSCAENAQVAPRLAAVDQSVRCGVAGYGHVLLKLTQSSRAGIVANLVYVCHELHYSWEVVACSVALLHRYLLVCTIEVTADITSLVAASVMLALKSYLKYKPKLQRKIIHLAYVAVYRREDMTVESLSDVYIQRALGREENMRALLFHDFCVVNLLDVLVASVSLEPFEKSSSSANISQVDEVANLKRREINEGDLRAEHPSKRLHHGGDRISSTVDDIPAVTPDRDLTLKRKRSTEENKRAGESLRNEILEDLKHIFSDAAHLSVLIAQFCPEVYLALSREILDAGALLFCLAVRSLQDVREKVSRGSVIYEHVHGDLFTPSKLSSLVMMSLRQVILITTDEMVQAVQLVALLLAEIPADERQWVLPAQALDMYSSSEIVSQLIRLWAISIPCLSNEMPVSGPGFQSKLVRNIWDILSDDAPVELGTSFSVSPTVSASGSSFSTFLMAPKVGIAHPLVSRVPGSPRTIVRMSGAAGNPDRGFKLRLPWLSLLTTEIQQSTISSSQSALKIRSTDIRTQLKNFPDYSVVKVPSDLLGNTFQTELRNAVDGMTTIGLRSWPLTKQFHRDAKKYGSASSTVGSEISELAILQRLQYLSRCSSVTAYDSNSLSLCDPTVIIPIGIVECEAQILQADNGGDDNSNKLSRSAIPAFTPSDFRPLLVTMPFLCSLSSLVPFLTIPSASSDGTIDWRDRMMVMMCGDLFAAIDHCLVSGVFFRWLSIDSFQLSSTGYLVLSCFDGAVLASSAKPAETSAKQHDKRQSLTNPESMSTSKRARHEAALAAATAAAHAALSKQATGFIPTQCLDSVAPEIVFGAAPSWQSSIYCAGAIAGQILTGKPLIKSGGSEDKYIQYIYRTLGTPKVMQCFSEFGSYPFSSLYSLQIKGEDGGFVETKSRISKVVTSVCAPSLLLLPNGTKSSNPQAAASTNDLPPGGVLDLFSRCLQLAPAKRSRPDSILSLELFAESSKYSTSDRLSMLREFSTQLQELKSSSVPASSVVNQFGRQEFVSFLSLCTSRVPPMSRPSPPPTVAPQETHLQRSSPHPPMPPGPPPRPPSLTASSPHSQSSRTSPSTIVQQGPPRIHASPPLPPARTTSRFSTPK